jgi:hypothetical protein
MQVIVIGAQRRFAAAEGHGRNHSRGLAAKQTFDDSSREKKNPSRSVAAIECVGFHCRSEHHRVDRLTIRSSFAAMIAGRT